MHQRTRAHFGRLGGWALLAALGTLGLAPAGRAEPVAFGNTRYRGTEVQGGLSVTIDGTLNVAVFKRQADTGDIWGTGSSTLAGGDFTPGVSPGAGSPALDTSARYLYVYQLVNDGGAKQTVGSIGLTVKDATSWGSFASLGLADDQGQLSATNPLGANGGPFDNALRTGGSSAVSIVAAAPPGSAVNQVELKPDGAGPGFDSFRAVWSINGGVADGQHSALFAYTSNTAPLAALFSAQGATSVNAATFGTVHGVPQGGGDGGSGTVGGDTGGGPSSTPEPSTLALSCLGLGCLGAQVWRKRRTRAS
jgi:hypothetical protein